MKLITRFELAAKNKNELHALLRETFNELARSNYNTPQQRRNALASMKIYKEKLPQGLRILDFLTTTSD